MCKMLFISGLPRFGSRFPLYLLTHELQMQAYVYPFLALASDKFANDLCLIYDFKAPIAPINRLNLFTVLFNFFDTEHIILDINRAWFERMPLLAEIFGIYTIVACVCNSLGILNSFERLLLKNELIAAKTIPQALNVAMYERINCRMSPTGAVGFALNAPQEAVFGIHAEKLVLTDFLSLVTDGPRTIAHLYNRLGKEPFEHDFENIAFKEGFKFDNRVGMLRLHPVGRSLKPREQQGFVLSPDIRRRFAKRAFWRVAVGSDGARFDLI